MEYRVTLVNNTYRVFMRDDPSHEWVLLKGECTLDEVAAVIKFDIAEQSAQVS